MDVTLLVSAVGTAGEIGAAIASGYLLYLTQQAGYLALLRRAAKMNRDLKRKHQSVDEALTLESLNWEDQWKK